MTAPSFPGPTVVVGRRPQLVLDLAPDVVAFLLDRTRRRAREVEVDLGVGGDPNSVNRS
jgi:hypothetical protein